jgi:hypothetical protein
MLGDAPAGYPFVVAHAAATSAIGGAPDAAAALAPAALPPLDVRRAPAEPTGSVFAHAAHSTAALHGAALANLATLH